MGSGKQHFIVNLVASSMYAVVGLLLHFPIEIIIIGFFWMLFGAFVPDVDSTHSKSVKEITSLMCAIVPLTAYITILTRVGSLSISFTMMIFLIGYAATRVMIPTVFKKFTNHRGMWHSIPVAIIIGLIIFIIHSDLNIQWRTILAMSGTIGVILHLLVDELFSIDFHGRVRIKKSFGTALKFIAKNKLSTCLTYCILGFLSFIICMELSGLEISKYI